MRHGLSSAHVFLHLLQRLARCCRLCSPVLVLICRGPWLRRDSRIRPGGRAAGRRAFFDKTGMSCRKTPRNPRTRRKAPGATDGVCFLWATLSLHKQRKVARSRQRAKQEAERKAIRAIAFDFRQLKIHRLRLGITKTGRMRSIRWLFRRKRRETSGQRAPYARLRRQLSRSTRIAGRSTKRVSAVANSSAASVVNATANRLCTPAASRRWIRAKPIAWCSRYSE